MTIWIALGLGVLIGAFLGALGGGGAILTVPALVYLLHQTAQDATTSSVIIVGAAAVTGMIGYARSGHVRWKLGLTFGAAGVLTAYAGTALNRQINQHYLLIGFAAVMLARATAMLLRSRTRTTVAAEATPVAAGWSPAPRKCQRDDTMEAWRHGCWDGPDLPDPTMRRSGRPPGWPAALAAATLPR